jgi:hypothetical protein
VPDVHLEFARPGEFVDRPAVVREVWRSQNLRVCKTQAGFRLHCDASVLDLDLSRSRGYGVVDAGLWDLALPRQREFFLLGLVILLHRHGLFTLHANGGVKEGTGFLLVGDSGCGKTTLTISLIREGWRYLADDALVLQRSSRGIEALALRQSFSCAPQTVNRFPELGAAIVDVPSAADGERVADLEALYPGSFVPCCVPSMLLYPQITRERQSRLVPLDPVGALIAMIPESAGIVADRPGGMRQLGVLRELVQQAASYRLLLGSDVFDAPAEVARLLWQARRG